MPAAELTDLSLLILADLALTGSRTRQRINTLTNNQSGSNSTNPPKAVRALAELGLVEIRAATGSYKVEITDAGLILQSRLMNLFREASSH